MSEPTDAGTYIQRQIDKDVAQIEAEIATLEKRLRRSRIYFAAFCGVLLVLFILNALQIVSNYAG